MSYFKGKDKWALIIGGSSGMGLASAKKMASEGMNLIILHRDRRSSMDQITVEFNKMKIDDGVQVESFNVDAVNVNKIKALVATFKDLLSGAKLKLVVHSIAKGNLKPSVGENSLKKDDFLLTIESMGISLNSWVQELLAEDLFEKDARVMSFTSEGSSRVFPSYAAVSAAKSVIESITRSLALELAPYHIKVNCLQPGTTDTFALRLIPGYEKIIEFSLIRNPYNRLTTPEDVANVVFVMTMDETSWINGTVIPVNGGEHLQ